MQEKYAEFSKRTWDFMRLTAEYWRKMIEHVVLTGSAEIVQHNHPIPPSYQGRVKPVSSDFVDSWNRN